MHKKLSGNYFNGDFWLCVEKRKPSEKHPTGEWIVQVLSELFFLSKVEHLTYVDYYVITFSSQHFDELMSRIQNRCQ